MVKAQSISHFGESVHHFAEIFESDTYLQNRTIMKPVAVRVVLAAESSH